MRYTLVGVEEAVPGVALRITGTVLQSLAADVGDGAGIPRVACGGVGQTVALSSVKPTLLSETLHL